MEKPLLIKKNMKKIEEKLLEYEIKKMKKRWKWIVRFHKKKECVWRGKTNKMKNLWKQKV